MFPGVLDGLGVLPYLLRVRLLRCDPNRPCIMIIGPGPLIAVFSGGSWRWNASSTISSGLSLLRRVRELDSCRRDEREGLLLEMAMMFPRRRQRMVLSQRDIKLSIFEKD